MKIKRKQIDWDNMAPLGLGGRLTVNWICVGLALAALFAWCVYTSHLSDLQSGLYWSKVSKRVLNPNAVMGPFYMTLPYAFHGFGFLALCMIPLSAAHYLYHYQDSRSIYLMRRLPDRWELWRRCLALPLLGAAACALLAVVHLLVFYAIYYFSTPKQCLLPGQWRMLWESLFN